MSFRSAAPTPEQSQRRLDHVLAAGMEHMALARGRAVPTGVGGTTRHRAAPIGTLEVANRGDPDHSRAIAVLAYTNLFDTFLRWELLGRTTTNLRAFSQNRATLYAPVFAFFAPLNELQQVFPELNSEASISVALPNPSPYPDKPAGCYLVLKINGQENRDSSTTWAAAMAREFIIPAGKHAEALANGSAIRPEWVNHVGLRTWQAALNGLVLALDRATTVTGADGLDFTLYRGLSGMPPMTVHEDLIKTLDSFSTVYTSTSKKREEALKFANQAVPDGDDDGSWLVALTVAGEGVRYIDVDAVLPTSWACWGFESEIILAPGVFYTHDTDFTEPSKPDQRLLTAHVTATDRALPDNILMLPAPFTDEANEMLVKAARDGREVLVNRLLFAEPQLVNPDYRLVQPGGNVGDAPFERMTALAWAVYKNTPKAQIVRDLLARFATVDMPVDLNIEWLKAAEDPMPEPFTDPTRHFNIRQGTALMLSSNTDYTRMLIECFADVNAKTGDRMFTPLIMASRLGLDTVAELLVSKNAAIDSLDANNRTALHSAVDNAVTPAFKTVKLLDILVSRGAIVTVEDNQGQTPLHLAKGAGVVSYLIEADADVNARDNNGLTPLLTMGENDAGSVRRLLNAKADVDAKNLNDNTLLHVTPNAEIAHLLLNAHASVDAKNLKGNTPLHMAASRLNVDIVSLLVDDLVEDGATVDERNVKGWTPLMVLAHVWAWSGRAAARPLLYEDALKVANSLLAGGANPLLRNDENLNAEELANGARVSSTEFWFEQQVSTKDTTLGDLIRKYSTRRKRAAPG